VRVREGAGGKQMVGLQTPYKEFLTSVEQYSQEKPAKISTVKMTRLH